MLEVNQMEHAATNITRAIFSSGIQKSRRKQNGYNSTLDSLLGDARSLPQESSSGQVDLSFVEADEAVVDQLWVEMGPIINSFLVSMESLLSSFGVIAEEQSPFLIHFNFPSDLLDVYLTFFPRDP